jgi:hypothetical protein
VYAHEVKLAISGTTIDSIDRVGGVSSDYEYFPQSAWEFEIAHDLYLQATQLLNLTPLTLLYRRVDNGGFCKNDDSR